MFLIRFQQAQPCPDGASNGESEDRVRDQNSGEEKKASAGAESDTSVKSSGLVKSPAPEAVGNPAQKHNRKRMRQSRGPVVDAEDAVRYRHHPVVERRLFEIGNTVEAGGDPVSRREHVAGSLRLNRIHVVHKTRRAGNAYKEDQASRGGDNPTWSSNAKRGFGIRTSSRGGLFHRLVQTNKVIKPGLSQPVLSSAHASIYWRILSRL